MADFGLSIAGLGAGVLGSVGGMAQAWHNDREGNKQRRQNQDHLLNEANMRFNALEEQLRYQARTAHNHAKGEAQKARALEAQLQHQARTAHHHAKGVAQEAREAHDQTHTHLLHIQQQNDNIIDSIKDLKKDHRRGHGDCNFTAGPSRARPGVPFVPPPFNPAAQMPLHGQMRPNRGPPIPFPPPGPMRPNQGPPAEGPHKQGNFFNPRFPNIPRRH